MILCGFVVPQHLTGYTLAAKVPGLLLAVSSGLVLGDEGPFAASSTAFRGNSSFGWVDFWFRPRYAALYVFALQLKHGR